MSASRTFISLAFLGLASTTGCKTIEPFDPFDPNAQAEVPDWILQQWEQKKHSCESSPYWSEPTAEMANWYYAGSFFEDGDTILGNEFWLIYPNEAFIDQGFTECTVVFDVSGTRIDSDQPGAAYAMNIQATVDEPQSDCPRNWADEDIYIGFEQYNETYHIVETPDNGVALRFPSATQFASGEQFGNGIQWMTDEQDCKIF